MGKALGIVWGTIAHCLARYLERQGLLVRDAEHSYLALESSDENLMDQLRGHSSQQENGASIDPLPNTPIKKAPDPNGSGALI